MNREGLTAELGHELSALDAGGPDRRAPESEHQLVRQSYERLFWRSERDFAGTEADEELLDMLDDAARRKSWSIGTVNSKSWAEVERASRLKVAKCPALSKVLEGEDGVARVQSRLYLVQRVNLGAEKALPWIDITRAGTDAGCVATRLASIAHLLSLQLKEPLWNALLSSTSSSSGRFGFTIDRIRPTTMLGGGRQDTEG